MKEILVTGGSGFIGRNLIQQLKKSGHQVIVIDNPSSSVLETLSSQNTSAYTSDNCLFYKANLRNQGLIFRIIEKHDIKCCIHLGAKKSIQNSLESSHEMVEVNVMGTLSVLEACSRCRVDSFIFSSSSVVYGNPTKTVPLSEDFPMNPRTLYGASKVAGEALVHCYKEKINNCIILRFFNVYGKGEKPSIAGVIPRFIENLREGRPPTIFGNGFQTRDFVHVSDVVEGIMKTMSLAGTKKIKPENTIFNIGTGIPTSLNEVVEALKNIIGVGSIKPIYRDLVPSDVVYSCANIEKARTILGYSPVVKIHEGLESLAS